MSNNTETKEYLDYEGLALYDEQIKKLLKTKDDQTEVIQNQLQWEPFDEQKYKFYLPPPDKIFKYRKGENIMACKGKGGKKKK